MTEPTRCQTAGNVAKTLYFPVTKSLEKMYEYRKTTAAVAVAILILALCAKYAKTMPMHNFRNGLSVAYHATADFLKNPVHAGLVGGISGAVYLLIGRELVNRDAKQRYMDTHLCYEIEEVELDGGKVSWDFDLDKKSGSKTYVCSPESRIHQKDREQFRLNWNQNAVKK